MKKTHYEKATFGSGCFWCTEAVFKLLAGVRAVTSGYSGGQVKDPTYKQVCTGETGHAEVVQIEYDPDLISYPDLLEVFWKTHDPTTPNRQGNDVGTQYRSVIFYHNDEQSEIAKAYRQQLEESHVWEYPIVTQVEPLKEFYKAEDYHQNYFNLNGSQLYCQNVVAPKVEKFKKEFKSRLKP